MRMFTLLGVARGRKISSLILVAIGFCLFVDRRNFDYLNSE